MSESQIASTVPTHRTATPDESAAGGDFAPCEPRTDGPAWKAAEAEGHDMTLVASLLRIPLEARLKVHNAALATVNMLRNLKLEAAPAIEESLSKDQPTP